MESSLLLLVLFAAFLAVRLLYASFRQLVPDETVYWSWSRHLAPGYLDHPPMIAMVIWLSTKLLGSTQLGVRLFAIVFACGSAAVIVLLARRLFGGVRLVNWCGVLLLASPLLNALGTLATPDSPLIFFCVCGMACAVMAVEEAGAETSRSGGGWWLLFGLFSGLAMLSKYTAVLLPASVVAALLTSRRGRAHFVRPWIYLSGVVALLVFSPVIYWNWQHDWASFRFQLSHGLSADADVQSSLSAGNQLRAAVSGVGEYLITQAAVWNPFLLVLGISALIWNARRYVALPASRQVLLWCSAAPLLFFAYASTRARGEANWPAFAYFPLTLLTVEYVARTWSGWRVSWLSAGLSVALVGTMIIQAPELLYLVRAPVPRKMDEMWAWRDLAKRLGELREGRQVVCSNQREAGEFAFYLPGQPDVWTSTLGSRPAAWDYLNDKPDFRSEERLIYVGGHLEQFCRMHGFALERMETLEKKMKSGRVRKRRAAFLRRLETLPTSNVSTAPSDERDAE